MKSDKPTDIVFRMWTDAPQTCIAFLPGVPANPGHIMAYEAIGQHGEASVECYRTHTTFATRAQRKALEQELRGIYGDVRVLARLPGVRT